MAAEARKLLEELMGVEALGGGPQENIPFTDKRVCRAYLCGLCPHSLFTTKMDLGPCSKLHSDKLKEEYEAARKERIENTLQQFVRDCDHRIDSARRRLEKPAAEGNAAPLLKEIADYTTEIATLTEQVEKLGNNELHAKVEEITAMKAEKEDELRQKHAQHSSAQEQNYLHMGYVAVRERLKELQEQRSSASMALQISGSTNNYNGSHDRYDDRRGRDRSRSPDRSRYRGRSSPPPSNSSLSRHERRY
ncbi:hypothetical protein BDF19DRAFT_433549 [Syncephalis fuscata]|nr:hypothetical protein BDF19DRAFT_433549 [Syncephalis fuscata]